MSVPRRTKNSIKKPEPVKPVAPIETVDDSVSIQSDIGSKRFPGHLEIERLEPQVLNSVIPEKPVMVDKSTMTSVVMVDNSTMTTNYTIFENRYYKFERMSNDELEHWTGLTIKRFEFLVYLLKPLRSPVECLSIKDQLLMTLMKYKKNYEYTDMAYWYKCNRNLVSQIVHIWTDIMYITFKRIDFWKLKYERSDLYTIMLDCTEIPIERPTDPSIQQQTFSTYKNTNTFKSLIGNDEAGSIVYVSNLYSGSISDREIVKRCNILDILTPGDAVLADRGFNISDLLEEKGILLNIPPYLRGKKQLTEIELMKTRRIASRRIKVENVIGLGKKFEILSDICKSHLWPIMNRIHYNCFMLANIRNPIVKIPDIDQ